MVRAPRRRRVEPWPLALAAALVAMMAVSVGFYRIAASHPDALVVDDAYEAGLAWNERAAQARRAEALGLDLALAMRLVEGGAEVALTATDAAGAPAAVEDAVLRRVRPAEGGLDAEVALRREGGAWVGHVPLPRPGRWRLAVEARVAGYPVRRSFLLRVGS